MSTDHAREVERVFDAWAQAGRDEGMADRHGLSARPVLEEMDLAPGEGFLDLGAGNAWAARWAKAAGARAVAVDVSAHMLARARQGPHDNVPALARASFEALPFAAESFATVFSMEALYYASELETALAEAFRVIKPGGGLHVLVDYYEGNPASRDWPEKTGVWMHRLSPEDWEQALAQAGFQAVKSRRVRSEEGEDWRAEHGSLHIHGRRP